MLGLSIIMKDLGLTLISRFLLFIFGYSSSEVEKKSTPTLPCNMKPTGLLRIFILLVKKGSDKSASIISTGNSSQLYPRNAKPTCIQRWLPWSCWKCKICAHTIHLNCNFADCWWILQPWEKLNEKFCLHE